MVCKTIYSGSNPLGTSTFLSGMTNFNTTGVKIPSVFYQSDDVVSLARELLGKKVCTSLEGEFTSAIITETEAYRSWGDKACHASGNKRTPRTEVMFGPGGNSYVYLCYGIHHLFNIVVNQKERAEAILIRAVEPIDGVDIMEARRRKKRSNPMITSGPGNVSQALGITTTLNAVDLAGDQIWLEDCGLKPTEIVATTRIGVDYAGEDAQHPWRFYLKDSPHVSRRCS